jgi:putative nucleotidyltransferase with HDIG domain
MAQGHVSALPATPLQVAARAAGGRAAAARVPMPALLVVAAVVAAGAAVLAHAVYQLHFQRFTPTWLLLAGLIVVSGRFSVYVPGVPVMLPTSDVFVFLTLLTCGPPVATLAVALDGLVLSLGQRQRRVHRALFNVAEPAVSIWLAGEASALLFGVPPSSGRVLDAVALIGPAGVMASVFFLSNSALHALAVAAETGVDPFTVWSRHFSRISLSAFAGASLAALVVQNTTRIELAAIGLALPLLVVSYLTFKGSADRLRDAEQHVAEMERLYMSTIEALAIAVDAKDQVTHGHIRRVQEYCTNLAKALGVTDARELKAIEAASLLHDIGKLAVPDDILNKPGKLTPAEFEQMKQHTVAGANILSVVDFPYPVVPIVLHHHENWDGSGYPAGIAGTAIPIGARILSVVDCYDALTSDRPYRRALSSDEAVAILRERRGSMYDPIVVDTFIRLLPVLRENVAQVAAEDAAARPAFVKTLLAGAARKTTIYAA